MRRATECFSMNSLMSMRTMWSAESNRYSASVLHSSVLPTPVGPRNRKEPSGRLGSLKPARERRIASDTTLTASSWPTTRLCSLSSMCSSLSRSPCGSFINFILAIGIGSLVIYFLMSLIGYAGVKTGVPYPVLARSSFGVWGANLAAIVRAIVACFWYGAQTSAASGAVVALLVRNDAIMAFHQHSHLLGHSTLDVICYVVIWALQLLIIQ